MLSAQLSFVYSVMGATGSGKSTFINTISNSSLQTSAGLRSCTDSVHESPPFQLDGRNVVLIDTPGFDDTSKSDTEILELIAQFLVTSYQDGRKLSGLIFIHRISDVRMGGVSTKNFRMFRKLCGESTLKNVIIVTNMWGNVEQEIGEAREAELATQDEFFKPVLDKGAKMMRHLNTVDSAQVIVRQVFPYQAEALQIQKEVVDEKKDLSQTAAADEIDRELKEIAEKQRLERERIQAEAEGKSDFSLPVWKRS
ncbi:hypothetical protein FA15DRAFT_583185 [Coprinopsis marcescibilis]|uniref:AIG1-type G domain-containing protein n=1 Tax=Coprinopsis marcescibilis TaxID=230819 RepID=A0A5C3L7N1_COPMA|nr:hypothetical protein FA15DRAFT_583185 [Coprinopsis marcescibilis]